MIPPIESRRSGVSLYSAHTMTTTDIIDELTRGIASALDERGKRQVEQIRRLIDCLGARSVLTYAERAKKADAQASFLVCRAHRFRTLGGIFYQLLKDDPQLTDDVRSYCFRTRKADKEKPPGTTDGASRDMDNTSQQEALYQP